ncbi:MAG TPA: hypothetical protein VEP49_00665 [Acidimicrobiia bacterium]|nr:hypothetical protein [Acidimicrobiia bacterium]
MLARRGVSGRWVSALLAVLVVGAALVVPTVQPGPAGAATLPRPEGAGPPVPASGMGTQAALDNPRCRHDDPKYGPYGRFDSTEIGGGPVCVKAWNATDDNGGATAQGVTKDRITVVALVPNEDQLKADPVAPKHREDNSPSTIQNALHDYMLPEMRFYETWGRDIEVRFVTSSGDDEASQRADLVTIKAMNPFAVLILAQPVHGTFKVLESGIAADKILVMGYAASQKDTAAQAPYRWNSNDPQAAAVNSAEVLGKQLVGKKAQYGGADVKSQTRKFGVVYVEDGIDYAGFSNILAKYGGKVTSSASFGAADVSDPTLVATQAATMVARMKAAGVTTVVMFVGYPLFTPLMQQATKLDYYPEWFFTGSGYSDLGLVARSYPPEQSEHTFGLSFIPPWVEPNTPAPGQLSYADEIDPLNWYWGVDHGSQNARLTTPVIWWLLAGIQAAGPDLTPKNFQQGLFAIPPRGGALEDRADNNLVAYGKGPKLPYPEYALSGYDFAPYWWDPTTTGPSNGLGTVGKGVGWFTDGGKRYVATTWPKKQFSWFDKQASIDEFATAPVPPLGYVGDCKNCPSTGAPGQPGAPSQSAVLFKANGSGASAG